MNPDNHDTHLDRKARALYREASARLSPRTLSRLRPRPASAQPERRAPVRPWQLAAACVAVCVVAVGAYRLAGPERPQPAPVASTAPAAAEPALPPPTGLYEQNALAGYEEDPELFLWLASAEAEPLAME